MKYVATLFLSFFLLSVPASASDWTMVSGDIKALNAAAEIGDVGAQIKLGMVDIAITKNYEEAAKWLHKAADQGNPEAQFQLGIVYEDGRGVAKDYAEAFKWFRLAADQGQRYAQRFIGDMYELGHGVPQDYAEAYFWQELAEKSGVVKTHKSPNDDYPTKHLTPEQKAAVDKRIAEWKSVSIPLSALSFASQFDYSYAAIHRKDYQAALQIWQPLANKGVSEAQNDIGMMYQAGKGLPQDYAEALKWFHKAADQGNPEAQVHIGRIYKDGTGMKRDYAEAAKWFLGAAEQGNAEGQIELSQLYKTGVGVKQDWAEAYFWLLAFRKPPPGFQASHSVGGLEDNSEPVKHLTSEQKASIEKRVNEWKPAPTIAYPTTALSGMMKL